MNHVPLHVRATLRGQIVMHKPLALDSLLAAAVALRDNIPPALSAEDLQPIEIPVAREPGGRFHLCSFAVASKEAHERRWINRRYPIDMAQALAEPKFARIPLSSGPCKSYRIPIEAAHLADDALDWWLLGDAEEVADLLNLVRYLGRRRAVGYGPVLRWTVESVEPWGNGYPVVRDGRPLRNLPPDWPGLASPRLAIEPLTFPYDRRNGVKAICAVPSLSSTPRALP